MANVLSTINAAVKGVQGVQRGITNRQEAQNRQELQTQKLQESQLRIDSQPTVSQSQQIIEAKIQRMEETNTKLQAENDQVRGEVSQQSLKRAMTKSEADQEFSPVMNVLKKDPFYAELFAPLASMQTMNISSESDLRLMENARQLEMDRLGTTPIEGQLPPDPNEQLPPEFNVSEASAFWVANPGLLKDQIKTIGVDGTVDTMSWNAFKFRNLGFEDMTDDQVKEELNKVKLERNKRKNNRESIGLTSTPTAEESNVDTRAQDLGVSSREIARQNQQAKTVGVTAGKAELANTSSDIIFAKFKTDRDPTGRDTFFSKELTEKDRLDILPEIRKIIAATGGLSSTAKKELPKIGKLLALGDTASRGLDEEATGIVDDIAGNLGAFIDKSAKGALRKSARSAYRNFKALQRNVLFGATLTPNEKADQDKNFGTLSEQLPSVLIKFKEQMNQVRATLLSTSNLEDPVLAKFYIGKDKKGIQEIIARLDASLIQLGADPKDLNPKADISPGASTPASTSPTFDPSKGTPNDFFNKLMRSK